MDTMPFLKFLPYLVTMTVVTYLVRVIPFVLFRKKITNRFLNSFLYYTPYAVLAVMTFPAILHATGSVYSAAGGFFVALLLAYFERSLLTVAAGACVTALAIDYLLLWL